MAVNFSLTISSRQKEEARWSPEAKQWVENDSTYFVQCA